MGSRAVTDSEGGSDLDHFRIEIFTHDVIPDTTIRHLWPQFGTQFGLQIEPNGYPPRPGIRLPGPVRWPEIGPKDAQMNGFGRAPKPFHLGGRHLFVVRNRPELNTDPIRSAF